MSARVKVGTWCKGQGWYLVQGSRLSARVKVGTRCKGQGWYQVQGSRLSARVKVERKGQGWYLVQGLRLVPGARVKVGTRCKGQGPIYGRGGVITRMRTGQPHGFGCPTHSETTQQQTLPQEKYATHTHHSIDAEIGKYTYM